MYSKKTALIDVLLLPLQRIFILYALQLLGFQENQFIWRGKGQANCVSNSTPFKMGWAFFLMLAFKVKVFNGL